MGYTVGQMIDLINEWDLPKGYTLEVVYEREVSNLNIKAINANGTTKHWASLCVCDDHLANPDIPELLLIGEEIFRDALRGKSPQPEVDPVKAAVHYEANRTLGREFGASFHRN